MKKVDIIFHNENNKYILSCEIADTFIKKTKGLMNREVLSEKEGMIFTFFLSWPRFFWMKNVKIPLDIIFVNRHMEIIKIYEASVEKGFFYKMYCSSGFCKYVIETNIGFCKKNGIKTGDTVEIF